MSCVVDMTLLVPCRCVIHALMPSMVFHLSLNDGLWSVHLMFIVRHHLLVSSMTVMFFIRILYVHIVVVHITTLPGSIRTAHSLSLFTSIDIVGIFIYPDKRKMACCQ